MSTVNPNYAYIFRSAPLLIVVLSPEPEFRIMSITDAHLSASLTKREEVTGRSVFEVFPDNPNDPNANGVATLKASLMRALINKVPDAMGAIRYDIPRGDGTFETRYWTPLNTPVLDSDGNVSHIINQVTDVTDYMRMQEKGEEYQQLTEQLRKEKQNLDGELYLRMQQLQVANQKMSDANEDLRRAKEELQSMNEELQAMHEEMRQQQEELMSLNEELSINNESLEKTGMALLLKAEELEKSNSFKTDFLSNMSHELRTPLNSMLILSKLLGKNVAGNLTDKQVEQSKIIHSAGKDLLMLIDDILDLSKIEAGKMEMVMDTVSFDEIINHIHDTFTNIAAEREIEFKVNKDGAVPTMLRTDKFRMEQILKNLLSNAFKFTAKGGRVLFNIELAPANTKYQHEILTHAEIDVLRFSVTDTGIGIPAEKQAAIFEAFKQADGSTSRKFGGSGLGLSISRQLASLLGGEIQLDSEPGKGSSFHLFLPVVYTAPEEFVTKLEEAGANASAAHVTLKYNTIPVMPLQDIRDVLRDKTILVTDDDARNITSLKAVLQPYGPNILSAGNGAAALKIMERRPGIDMVLLDLMMPEMDGYETIKRIRKKDKYNKLPIIVLTARTMKEDREKCFAAGASDYLSKPIDVQHLLAMMAIWLSGKNTIR